MSEINHFQKERILKNREKAVLKRKELATDRILSAAVEEIEKNQSKRTKNQTQDPVIKRPGHLIDTGGGFLLDEDEEDEVTKSVQIVEETPAPCFFDPSDRLLCDVCGQEFMESFLYKHFTVPVCNVCRSKEYESTNDNSDVEEEDDERKGERCKYSLLTKTDCKTEYFLKDADLDVREPALKYILKKNPHNPRWGDMKLYILCQVEERALEVWGSWEKLDEEKEKRQLNKEKVKQKKFDKKMKELRMTVRGSLYKKQIGVHEHEYGAERYNEEDDTYSKTCSICQHLVTYEKM